MIQNNTRVLRRILLIACMTSQHPTLHFLNPLPIRTNEVQPHLKQDVLHREIRSHTPNRDHFFLRFSFAFGRWEEIECAGFVQADVVWGDPFAFAIVRIRWVIPDGHFGS